VKNYVLSQLKFGMDRTARHFTDTENGRSPNAQK